MPAADHARSIVPRWTLYPGCPSLREAQQEPFIYSPGCQVRLLSVRVAGSLADLVIFLLTGKLEKLVNDLPVTWMAISQPVSACHMRVRDYLSSMGVWALFVLACLSLRLPSSAAPLPHPLPLALPLCFHTQALGPVLQILEEKRKNMLNRAACVLQGFVFALF